MKSISPSKPGVLQIFPLSGYKLILVTCLSFILTAEVVFGQSIVQENTSLSTWFYSLTILLSVIFFTYVFSVLRKAMLVLRQNGQSVDLTFPIFREMARNRTVVTVIVVFIVIVGIYFAVNYKP